MVKGASSYKVASSIMFTLCALGLQSRRGAAMALCLASDSHEIFEPLSQEFKATFDCKVRGFLVTARRTFLVNKSTISGGFPITPQLYKTKQEHRNDILSLS